MRLYQVYECEFEEFPGDSTPPYAILSHTWGTKGSEVTCNELLGSVSDATKRKAGYDKVKQCCERAKIDGFEYIWIDSCCINKLGADANELQEALSSMYKWYMRAAVCYVLFDDFNVDEHVKSSSTSSKKSHFWRKKLRSCRWFERGWTLQEHIAPKSRKYFDQNWRCIDDHVPRSELEDLIEEVTGIPRNILGNQDAIHSMSVASRMRWAANRKTTKGEDLAYSLLGIFNVQMRVHYGEGREEAFLRLQKKIIKKYDDESIFAWSVDRPGYLGLLAESPDWFIDCTKMERYPHQGSSSPWIMTNQGLNVSLLMLEQEYTGGYETDYSAFINWVDPNGGICPIITLVRKSEGKLVRLAKLTTGLMNTKAKRLAITVPQERQRPAIPPIEFSCFYQDDSLVWLPFLPSEQSDWVIDSTPCSHTFLCQEPSFIASHDSYLAAIVVKTENSKGEYSRLCTVVMRIRSLPTGWASVCSITPGGSWKIPGEKDWEPKHEPENTDVMPLTMREEYKGYKITAQAPTSFEWFQRAPIYINVTIERTSAVGFLRPPSPKFHVPITNKLLEYTPIDEEMINVQVVDTDATAAGSVSSDEEAMGVDEEQQEAWRYADYGLSDWSYYDGKALEEANT